MRSVFFRRSLEAGSIARGGRRTAGGMKSELRFSKHDLDFASRADPPPPPAASFYFVLFHYALFQSSLLPSPHPLVPSRPFPVFVRRVSVVRGSRDRAFPRAPVVRKIIGHASLSSLSPTFSSCSSSASYSSCFIFRRIFLFLLRSRADKRPGREEIGGALRFAKALVLQSATPVARIAE